MLRKIPTYLKTARLSLRWSIRKGLRDVGYVPYPYIFLEKTPFGGHLLRARLNALFAVALVAVSGLSVFSARNCFCLLTLCLALPSSWLQIKSVSILRLSLSVFPVASVNPIVFKEIERAKNLLSMRAQLLFCLEAIPRLARGA